MHLVFINQYYPPDAAPTGLMLADVVSSLAAMGHQVTVLCATGGYAGGKANLIGAPLAPDPPAQGRITIRRIGATAFGRGTFIGKLADYTGFYAGVAGQLTCMWPRPDRIVALTTPPYLSVLARLTSRLRGADYAHWVMDLYPDVMCAHGMLAERSLLARTLRRLARWGFGGGRCRYVMTLGPDMHERISQYLNPGTRSGWIPLWGTANDALCGVPHPPDDAPGPLVLMYSGNMGLGHLFEDFLHAAATRGSGFRWRFHGDGRRRSEIEEFLDAHPDAPVELSGYVPHESLAAHLASADVHLASLDPAWAGTMVPSKLQGIFATGRPVLFIGPADCSMARWIAESGGGWVVAPGDRGALAAALDEACDRDLRLRKGEAAFAYAQRHFDRAANSRRIGEALAASR
jgi:colanic acid biosynthesis glycosyl transferase WcaI